MKNTLEFMKSLKELFIFLIGGIPPSFYRDEREDTGQLQPPVVIVRNDSGIRIQFIAQPHSIQTIHYHLNSTEARTIQSNINKGLEEIREVTLSMYEKQLLIWYQARFDLSSPTGDKAIIRSISKQPIKVVFSKDDIKLRIMNTIGSDKPWQSLAYIVDVEVLLLGGIPTVYKILNYYPEDTFDPST